VNWDTRTWRYRSNDNVIKIIENNYIVLNLKKDDPFILIFPREVEEGNNSSDINTDNFFMAVSVISPLPSKYREYIDIFFESEVR